ncbi:MAG: hypothetical protein A2V67_06265 [Deltaproteobacteria bacterium RBG_13_61_14]|nr:MAG: hypothetical protein A2V67_06265 [Deltaproteobacteria bacterium RBG_13_61_14]
MNKKQKGVVLAGAMVIVLMGLIPPWKYLKGGAHRIERPGSYGLIMAPYIIKKKKSPDASDKAVSDDVKAFLALSQPPKTSAFDQCYTEDNNCGARVDTTRLLIQWFIVAIFTGAWVMFLKDERPPVQR